MDAMKIGRALLALALVPAVPAPAQTVQKCVARDGHARYQSAPCARGERVADVWDATPDPVAPPDDVPPPRTRGATARMASRRTASAALDRRIARTSDDRCERARAYRDAVERRAGLERDYDLLSTLQRRVFDACR